MSDPDLESLRQQCASPLPVPPSEEMDEAIRLVISFLRDDFDGIADQPIGLTATQEQMEALLREPPPEEGQPFVRVLEEFREKVLPYSLRPHHPRFLAFVPGAPTFLSILGDWLCAGTNFFAGVWKEAPSAAQVEVVILDWFREFLGMPPETAGILTGGGSEANLIALVAAREAARERDHSRLRAYVCGQRHWSIDRALFVMGLNPRMVRSVAVDDDGKMIVGELKRAIQQDRSGGGFPWLVVANAGATNTGAIDPLLEINRVCREEGLWFHVDAAYGWAAVLSEKQGKDLAGIGQADSITLDPHKWFAQTFDAGCVLVRRGELLSQTFQMRPEYMQDVVPREGEVNFCDRGIALTRRFRALKIWLSLKVLGVGWFRHLVDHCCGLAAYAASLLRSRGCFEVAAGPGLSILCFRFVPPGFPGTQDQLNELNLKLCEKVLESGAAFLSTTRWREQVCLRVCFVNYRTTAADVDRVVDLLERLGKE